MGRKLILILGKVARSLRWAGLGYILEWSRDTLDSIFIRAGKLPLVIKISGLKVGGYLRHRSFLDHLATGKYEPFTRELFEASLKPGMLVIDGGAHIGYFSLLAARIVGNNGKVFAFEPDPHNFAALLANVARNHCINVTPIWKALYNSIENLTFYQSSGTTSSSPIRRALSGKAKEIRVPSTTLDIELEGLTIHNISIKLDIEGSEIIALQGMRDVFQKSESVVLFLEVNPPALNDAGFKPDDLIRELESLRFRVHFIDESNKTLLPINRATISQKGNLYCRRGS